jgi:hypothetical protein
VQQQCRAVRIVVVVADFSAEAAQAHFLLRARNTTHHNTVLHSSYSDFTVPALAT